MNEGRRYINETMKISILDNIRKHLRKEDKELFSNLEGLIENNHSKARVDLGDLSFNNHFSRINHIKQASSLYRLTIKYGNTEAVSQFGMMCFDAEEYKMA
ncbi:hypothetical protein SAMN04488700_0152 [Carnobacterium iners]|uniref:Uncharacterized protein n=1 Tax=Carnobacterium iners TaxID=1073423 RepID=A0A1X7MR21_9LACT|nr:hypothetical protein [Carnobacterium iners]SEK78527.1 hypothetical protein SAMN04488114_11155 [Carnobacterium iners]SMH26486.1 hypothetical protein SAMN04488700_0152 [Carnobacterium iners]